MIDKFEKLHNNIGTVGWWDGGTGGKEWQWDELEKAWAELGTVRRRFRISEPEFHHPRLKCPLNSPSNFALLKALVEI